MPSPKYEREIRSLLDGMDEFLHEEQAKAPLQFKPRPRVPPWGGNAGTVWHWLSRKSFLSAVVLVVAGRFLVLPFFGPTIAMLFGLAAGLLITWSLWQGVRRVRVGPTIERRWRGQTLPPPPGSLQRALTRWWTRGRR